MHDPGVSVPQEMVSEAQKGAQQRKISRRTLVAGLVGTVTVVGGGVAWWELTPHPLYTYHGHDGYPVLGVAWSSDGKRIASCAMDGIVQIWNALDGQRVFTCKELNSHQPAMAWSPDNKYLVFTNNDDSLQIWDVQRRKLVTTYRRPESLISALAWSPESKRLAIGYADRVVQVVYIEHIADEKYIYTRSGHNDQVSALAWSPAGTRIASSSWDTTVQIWDATDGSNTLIYHGHGHYPVSTVAWVPGGKYIASASGPIEDAMPLIMPDVQVWDAVNGHQIYVYRGHENYVDALAWSSDSRRIASAAQDATVRVWDAADGQHNYIYRGHTNIVYAVSWSPSGGYIASAGNDGTVQVWIAK